MPLTIRSCPEATKQANIRFQRIRRLRMAGAPAWFIKVDQARMWSNRKGYVAFENCPGYWGLVEKHVMPLLPTEVIFAG